jgi:hypothetical protein
MRYAAFDLSSKLGWGAWDGHASKPLLGTKTIVGWDYDSGTMLELYRKWLGDFLRIHRPQKVAIESWYIAPHMDGATIGKQIMLSGFTQWACKASGTPFHLVTAGQWRKTWYGSARRPEGNDWKLMAVNRCKALGWEAQDHNAAEAGGILDWLISEVGRETSTWRSEHVLMPEAFGVKGRRNPAITGADIDAAITGLGF